MEYYALNAAHVRQRRAEALVRERKFEEAAECHELAAHLFSQVQPDLIEIKPATSMTSVCLSSSSAMSFQSRFAIESLVLQRDYHKRQAAIVRMKQVQFEEYRTTLEVQRRDSLPRQAAQECEMRSDRELLVTIAGNTEKSLRQAIYKSMEEQENLLGLFLIFQNGNWVFEQPKDAGALMEKMQTVNAQLRSLIGTLLSQLQARELQVKLLTEQLQVVSASCDDDTPVGGVGAADSVRLSPLPPLAPLEMPLFDFTTS